LVGSFVLGMPSIRTNNFPESGRGLGHVTATIFGSTVGYPSDSLASCHYIAVTAVSVRLTSTEIMHYSRRLPHSTELTDLRMTLISSRRSHVFAGIYSRMHCEVHYVMFDRTRRLHFPSDRSSSSSVNQVITSSVTLTPSITPSQIPSTRHTLLFFFTT